jgi:Flp pilus assembly protein TadG
LNRLRSLRARGSRGAAVVDFVLVLVVLVPVFLGILQLTLVLLVRNTLAAAASEGARYAATLDRSPADGAARTRDQIEGALAAKFAQDVTADSVLVDGAPGVEVRVHVVVPALGIGGPAVELTVTGHAIEEER